MKLQPNIGSDRSWVWKVTADYAETPPTVETLAIRFANSESGSTGCSFDFNDTYLILRPDAGQFKAAFEEAQRKNAGTHNAEVVTAGTSPEEPVKPAEEPAKPAEEEPAPQAPEEKEETTEAEETPKD
jgi:Ran-binding protein 1